jgi:stearoyl-CoA desaturase (Delta-9 desaturase)
MMPSVKSAVKDRLVEDKKAQSRKISKKSSEIDWINVAFLTITPLLAIAGIPIHLHFVGLTWPTMAIFAFYLLATGLSITGGYHRLFAHKSYDANYFVKLLFLFFGAAACQNSALKWASDHRDHHRYVDQAPDPYNIQKGFFYAHMGWIFLKDAGDYSYDNVRDLLKDRTVYWQHRFYIPLAISIGFVLPFLLGFTLFGDAWGCLLWAGIVRVVIVHHSTFLINSLCHYVGTRPYSLKGSARDSALAAFLTYGEGYHNFHHQFQYDYRNGVRWYHWDPTKWMIKSLESIRLVKNLRRASEETIFKTRLQVQREKLQQRLTGLSDEFSNALEQQLHSAQESLLSARSRWNQLKSEYNLVKVSMDAKRKEISLKLEQELQSAKIHLKEAHASWNRLIQEFYRSLSNSPIDVA